MTDVSLEVTREEINSGVKKANNLNGTADEINTVLNSVSGKQDKLISGTNIKTINNKSILGSGNITIEGGGGGGGSSDYYPPLLSTMWSDHLLNDESWLRADTFSWQDGTTYSTAFEKLVEEYNASTSVEETEGDITFKRTANGYKIATADYETAILNKYSNDGIAWYYVLDEENKKFKLPRTKFGFEGLRDNVGDNIDESLPNHGHTLTVEYGATTNSSYSPGSTKSYEQVADINAITKYGNTYSVQGATNSTYQDNAPVQERATQMYLYFYVGEYSQTATEQTAGLNAELFNGKADVSAVDALSTRVDGIGDRTYVKATYINGSEGYRIWSDGYCEQWGKSGATGARTVTFLKTFIDSNYGVSMCVWRGYEYFYACVGDPKTSTSMVIRPTDTSDWCDVWWKVWGYLKEGEY